MQWDGHLNKSGLKCRFFYLALFGGLFACCAGLQPADAQSSEFLVVSDIHFNPMPDKSLVADLAATDPTRWETILKRSKLTRFSQYGEDTNWWLLQSALDQMGTTLPHPAFIMIAGDLLAHEFPATYAELGRDNDREHYRSFVLKTMEFLALEFRKRFGDTGILVTPGNNDEECGDYSIEANAEFLNDTAELARNTVQAESGFKNSWNAVGSYNVPHPTIRGVRIISLNSVVFSNKYHAASFRQGCSPVASNAPNDLLAWLESNLMTAKLANEKVWLMLHIPPGIDGLATAHQYESLANLAVSPTEATCSRAVVPTWVASWTSRFASLLERYEDTVIASFAGHTHTDDFRLIAGADSNKEFILINPPISPVYRQNPAFRVVTFESDGRLADQSTYYLTNLHSANSETQGRWTKEYQFSLEWKAKQIDVSSLRAIRSQIGSDQESRDR